MRFDLEFNMVSQLSSNGLAELSEMFYGNDNKWLTPSRWDSQSLINKDQAAKSNIDVSKYNNMSNIPSWLYSSGVSSSDDISLNRLIARNSMICPLFNAGSVYFNRYKFNWSNSTIRKEVLFNPWLGHYYCEVDSDIDVKSIQAFTLKFKYPGYISYEKTWEFVEFIENEDLSFRSNLEATFSAYPTKDYKITLVSYDDVSIVILSGDKIQVRDLNIGTAYANKGSIMAIGEYPVIEESVELNNLSCDDCEYRFFSSTMVFNNVTDKDVNVFVCYDVSPVLVYSQLERFNSNDVVYAHANILPSAIGFNNGLIALHNAGSAGGTIQTDDGVNIVIPTGLTIDVDRTEASVLDSVRCTAKMSGIDNMPVKDAKIKFQLSSVSEDVKFLESGAMSYEAYTGINGEVTANAFIDRDRFGWYLQKEWVSGNKISIPYDIHTEMTDEIYLYFITSDDPILGKLFARDFEASIEESYASETSLETYDVEGRKVAYVKLMNRNKGGSNIVYSSFVKPVSISRNESFLFDFKNLYIKNSQQDIARFISSLPDYMSMQVSTPVRSYSAESLGYTKGTLPNDVLDIYRAKVTDGTIIEFEDSIPAYDNIIGYWLITGSSVDVAVKAIFDDGNSFMHLESNEVSISTTNYIKSEYEFILTDSETESQNTALSSFGYYTVSEYLDNPYKQNACTYTCRYSDPIRKKCLFKEGKYSKYYDTDGSSGICTKPANHNLLDESDRCPITSNKYIKGPDGNLLLEQKLVSEDTIVDVYSWAAQASFNSYEGKEPHIALIDGNISQATFDAMITSGDILPVHVINEDYEENAWGFINPFIMLAEKLA